MATATSLLTLEQFHQRYANEAGWEFWFGEAIRKPLPTWLHSVLQALLAELLYDAGYVAGSELDLRIDPQWQPRPDVTAATAIRGRYPTQPNQVDLVIEILSDDQMTALLQKCSHHVRIGISEIYVFDPEGRRIWKWNRDENDLIRCRTLLLPNGATLTEDSIWLEFQKRLYPQKASTVET